MQFLSFLIYSFIYLVGVGSLISNYFGYSPFVCFSFQTNEIFLNPLEDWVTLFNRFKYGQWAVDSGYNFALFLCFILFFPTWILLWFLIRRLNPLKKIKIFFKRTLASSTPSFTEKKSFERPQPMPKTLSFGMPIPESTPQKTPVQTADQEKTSENTQSDLSSEPLSNETKNAIRTIGTKYGFDMFENVRLGKYLVPLVLATDTKALLLYFLTENREWIADEEISEDTPEPTWFSAEGLITSPVYEMTQASVLLHEKEPDSEIIPVIVLLDGTILNVELMQPSWDEVKAHVVYWDEIAADEHLKSLEQLLEAENPPSDETQN